LVQKIDLYNKGPLTMTFKGCNRFFTTCSWCHIINAGPVRSLLYTL